MSTTLNGSVVLETRGLDVTFGSLRALSDVSVVLTGPATVGLIGPNGAGKSTLLNALTGFVPIRSGSVRIDGDDVTAFTPQQHARQGVLRSFQTSRLLEDETVLTNVMLGAEVIDKPGIVRQLLGTPKARRSERDIEQKALIALNRLDIMHLARRPAQDLSTAVRRLVELARVLVAEPRVLLMDEPAAGLDARSRMRLSASLRVMHREHPCLLVLVEHDVSIVRRVCDRTIVLVSGGVLADGPTGEVLERTDVRAAYFGDEQHAAS